MVAEGAQVMVADKLGDRARAVVEEIEAGGGVAVAHELDLGMPDEVSGMIGAAVRRSAASISCTTTPPPPTLCWTTRCGNH